MKIREYDNRSAWWEANGDRAMVKPISPPPCVEIVARGVVVAKVYPARGESRDDMRARADRMARAYGGEAQEVSHAQ